MRKNWSSQLHVPAKATGDNTIGSLSYSRPLEASENAVIAMKPPWNQLACDCEGYGYQTTMPVEAGRLGDFGRRSRHDQGLKLKNDSLLGRMQNAYPELRPPPKPRGMSRISRAPVGTSQIGPGFQTGRNYSGGLVTAVGIVAVPQHESLT